MEYIPYKRSLYNKEMKIQEEHHVRFKVCQRKSRHRKAEH